MKAILAVLLFLFLINCGSSPKTEEKPTVNKRAGMVEDSKIDGCAKFDTPEDCVMAKEINTTLAYYLGSKNDVIKISISKLDPSTLPITKIKTSQQLNLYRKKIKDPDPKLNTPYFEPKADAKPLGVQDLVEFIQDEQEGIPQGKSPLQVKQERIAIQMAEAEKRRLDNLQREEKEKERIRKEIAAFPYTIELYCFSNITDEKIDMSECANKLKPSLVVSIPSENKVYANFPTSEFLAGTLTDSNMKLPKDFSVELNSAGLDSSTLFQVIIRDRVPPWESEPKPKFVLGQKFNIIP